MKTRVTILIAALILASLMLAACGPAASQAPAETRAPAPAGGGACRPAQTGWDPTKADTGTRGMNIVYNQEPDQAVGLFSGMTASSMTFQMFGIGPGKWDEKNNLIPYMAAEIPSTENGGVSSDGLTVTWKLRPCVFWSDGEPITSTDLRFTWQVIVDPGNASMSNVGYDEISGIETPDAQTAVVHFKSLYPAWPTLFNLGPNSVGGLLPEHVFRGKTKLEKDPQIHQPTWAGGPFAIKEWVAGDHMTLVRNPNYFGTPAKLDFINLKFLTDPEAGIAALRAGDADLGFFAESDIEALQALASEGIRLRVDPTPDFEHLFFNLGVTNSAVTDSNGKVIGNSDVAGFCPFQDPNVRKAIILGTDRLSFIKNYLKEDEKSFIATLWPNSYWNNASLTPYPYDPTHAAELLDAAGYKVGGDGIRSGTCDGKPVKFSLGIETTPDQRRVDNVLAIQSDLRKIGIEIKPNHIPGGTLFGSYADGADLAVGKYDMGIFATGFYPDPDATSSWDCADVTSKDNPGGGNLYHVCDPKLDEMFKQGLATADPAARKKVYDQIQQYMYDQALMVPLYARASIYGYSSRLVFPPSSGYSSFAWDMEYFDVK